MLAVACRLRIIRELWLSIRGDTPKRWLGPGCSAGTSSVREALWLNLIQIHSLARWIYLGFVQSCWIDASLPEKLPGCILGCSETATLLCYSVNCSFSHQWNLVAWGGKKKRTTLTWPPGKCLGLFNLLLDIKTGSTYPTCSFWKHLPWRWHSLGMRIFGASLLQLLSQDLECSQCLFLFCFVLNGSTLSLLL